MRSTKQRLQGCKSRNTVVPESFTSERKTVLSLCRRFEDEVREGGGEEEKEVEVDVDGEGSRDAEVLLLKEQDRWGGEWGESTW